MKRGLVWMSLGLVAPLTHAVPTAAATPSIAAPAPAKAKKSKQRPKPREKDSEPGEPNETVRQIVSGDTPEHSAAPARESAELAAMRALDAELFPPRRRGSTSPWSATLPVPRQGPEVNASGLPKAKTPEVTERQSKTPSLDWLAKLNKPDFPVRMDPKVVKYLRYYKENKRGRNLVAAYARKSGRYVAAIRRVLKKQGLPQDLCWLAMVESAYDATIHSHAGAAGLWQFMPATGRIYGLTVNRRVDERLDPERSTVAAVRHLEDLYKRFGSWELAFGAYNMGYGGMLSAVRRFNTNDYWELTRLEAGLPYETALYVPKIMALAIAMKNCKFFGCDTVKRDAALHFGDDGADELSVAPGVTLDDVADAIGVDEDEIADLNPHVIGSRMPPLQQASQPRKGWTVYVPKGKGQKALEKLPAIHKRRHLGTHRVRFGEPIEAVAAAFGTSVGYLEALNDLRRHESPRPGQVVFVPAGRNPKPVAEVAKKLTPIAVVPKQAFVYSGRRRVFYAPIFGDTIDQVAKACGVTVADVQRWNHLDDGARLQEGMHLQLFLPVDHHPPGVVLYEEPMVSVKTVESEAFFEHAVGGRGRERRVIEVEKGDTWRRIGRRYGCSLGYLERINHQSRYSQLSPGDEIIVYAKKSRLKTLDARAAKKAEESRSATSEDAAPSP